MDIAEFISAIENDPDLRGKISYRCMKGRDGTDYYHLAGPTDDQAAKVLQSRDLFSCYSAKTKVVSNGSLEVVPLEIIAETQ